MPCLPIRLHPGDDLRQALEAAVARSHPQGCFVVSGIGSLLDPRLRLAGADETACCAGPFELLSLSGSVTPSGSHLHMVIADGRGAVLGGHVLPGNRVRTTAEVLLVPTTGWQLSRALDTGTGYAELVIREAPP